MMLVLEMRIETQCHPSIIRTYRNTNHAGVHDSSVWTMQTSYQ
jgi:hypothetical protein